MILALAGAAGLAIDDAHLFHQLRDEAEQFQRLLVPGFLTCILSRLPPPTGPLLPGVLGGDWYDALLVAEDTCTAVIGDVLGHDVHAAAAMSQTRHMLRALLYDRHSSPSDILARLDRALQAITETPVTTACLARLEPAGPGIWTLRWSSAGHCSPIVITPDGQARYLSIDPDLPLGVDTAVPRRNHLHPVPAGSTLVLFTDGLIECSHESIDVGLERLVALAGEHAHLPLRSFVQTLTDRHPSDTHDDMAVLAVRTPAAPTQHDPHQS
ncbi:PP2C family protein-serine/threonine phosphatase [Actinacidiphila glaucinigra]|uniref:PP2C family protein-serine/threonine phosphatase n=1 Tax=Actinacidiphila glaucinigra TaxID=235986 RepID=UPI0035DADC36